MHYQVVIPNPVQKQLNDVPERECIKSKGYEKEESSHNKPYKEVYHNWL